VFYVHIASLPKFNGTKPKGSQWQLNSSQRITAATSISIGRVQNKLAVAPRRRVCCSFNGLTSIKEIYGLSNEGLQANMGQSGRILELEEENEELKDQKAMMAMEGPVAGFGGDLSAEEQAHQQAKQQHCS
jgi:hypothetical protein